MGEKNDDAPKHHEQAPKTADRSRTQWVIWGELMQLIMQNNARTCLNESANLDGLGR